MIPPKSWRGGGAVVSALRGAPSTQWPDALLTPRPRQRLRHDVAESLSSRRALATKPQIQGGRDTRHPRELCALEPGWEWVPWHPGGRGRLGGPHVCTELAWLLPERACPRSFSPTPQVRHVKLWVPTGLITTGWHVPSVCARGHGPRPSCGSRPGPEATPRLRLGFIPPSPGGWNRRVGAGPVPPEASLLGVQTAISSPCPPGLSLCASVS